MRRELAARHPRLDLLCRFAHPLERQVPDRRPLTHLVVRTIVGQLVSTAAARSIMTRLLDVHGDMDGVVRWAMRRRPSDPPSHGLSRAKRTAISHWGRFLEREGDPRDIWATLTAEELLERITALRGLGVWSGQMIAIFGFGHPGIWPEGDAGVMRVARVAFQGVRAPTVRRLIAGHETHVALCCWSVLDRGRLPELTEAVGEPPRPRARSRKRR